MSNNYILSESDKNYFTNEEACKIKDSDNPISTKNVLVDKYRAAQREVDFAETAQKHRKIDLDKAKANYERVKDKSDNTTGVYKPAFVLKTTSAAAEVTALEKFVEIGEGVLADLKSKAWENKTTGPNPEDLYSDNYVCPVFRALAKKIEKPKVVPKPEPKTEPKPEPKVAPKAKPKTEPKHEAMNKEDAPVKLNNNK